MSYRLRATPQAEQDIEDAFDWYESERVSLGIEFLNELHAVYDRVEENPLKYEVLKFDTRRALTRRFPYAVYFIVENELIVILGVLHAARDPLRWQQRRSYRVSEPPSSGSVAVASAQLCCRAVGATRSDQTSVSTVFGKSTRNVPISARDHMSEAELIFTALAELSTRQVAESVQATGIPENKAAAKTGNKVVSASNYLSATAKKVRGRNTAKKAIRHKT